jgi:hypothetical protein
MTVLEGNSIMIDSKEASQALSDINEMVRRVRQSRIYELASQFMVVAGVFVTVGNLATYFVPRHGGYIWIAINVLTFIVTAVIGAVSARRAGIQSFDHRVLLAFVLFYGFGLLTTVVIGHFGPRGMGTFWPIYFMLFYSLAGLWFGRAFIYIGLGITVLTLIGYFFITTDLFLIWMAMVNGGGLILSGLWMRWGE